MSCRSYTAVAVLLLIVLLSGCGRKTPLVPPQKLVPVKINDLRFDLDESGVTLKWSYPTKMENGDKLQAIESFEIYRAVIPEEEFCQGCPVQYEDALVIDGGSLPASGETSTAVYREGYLQSGYRYLYKVRSRAGWWYPSADSNVVSFVRGVPPKAPQGLRIEAGDMTLALSWEPVSENIEDKTLEEFPLYQVYRKKGSQDFTAVASPFREATFIDTGLINEKNYIYKVRALVRYGETLQAGAASQPADGMPRDLIPPPQPQQLVAVEIPAGVKLVWQTVQTDDLGGYRIYRRAEESVEPEMIAEVGPRQNQYIDRTATAGRKLFYSVTSFDTAHAVNESPPAAEAVVDLR
jgi:hypothetical protein